MRELMRNILYVRLLDGKVTELIVLPQWSSSTGFKYFSLAKSVGYGTEWTLRHKEFVGNPEGQIGEISGKLITFERATEEIVQTLLNEWNDSSANGRISAWCDKVEKLYPELTPPDKARLRECGEKTKYW